MFKAPGLKSRFIQTVRVSANTGESKNPKMFTESLDFFDFLDFNGIFGIFWVEPKKKPGKCLDFADVAGQNHYILYFFGFCNETQKKT